MNKIFYPIFVTLCIFLTPSLYAQNDTDCPDFLDQIDTTGDPACGFFDSMGKWINLCSPCGNKIADDDCANTPTLSICELDGFSSSTSGFTIDLGPEGIGWCSPGGPFTVFNNNMWIGFTASTNVIDLFIELECDIDSGGVQIGIVSAPSCAEVNPIVCLNGDGDGVAVIDDVTLRTEDLIPGEPYFLVFDGFAGGADDMGCDFTIDVLDGFPEPGISTQVQNPGTLCPDILNPPDFLPFSGSAQSGAIVDVIVDLATGGTTDLLFNWFDPNGDLIAQTGPSDIFGNIVRGSLDGTFFTEPGIVTVQVVDLGSCCPICVEVELLVLTPPPAFADAIGSSTLTGLPELNCINESLLVQGGPIDDGIPVAEGWSLEDGNGVRRALDVVLVSVEGRLDEIEINRQLIEEHFPGQDQGTARVVYGFVFSFEQPCFGEAFVEIPFDFRDPELAIDDPVDLDCALNPSVVLDASGTVVADNHTSSFVWEPADGISFIVDADTDMPTVFNNGIYNVTVTDLVNGCTTVGSIEVMGAVDPPILGTIEDVTLDCNTMSANVSTTGTAPDPIQYSWVGPNGNLGVTIPALSNITEPGSYTLTATNTVNQCIGQISFTVSINMPTLIIDGVRDTFLICNDAEIIFPPVSVSGANGPFSYSWINDIGIEVSNSPILIADVGGNYTLTVTDIESGCTASAISTVTGNASVPTADAGLPQVLNCLNANAGVTLDGSASSGVGSLSYEWLSPSGTVLGTSAMITVVAEGNYTLVVTDNFSGCTQQSTVQVFSDLTAPENVTITSSGSLSCGQSEVTLMATSTTAGNLQYCWTDQGLNPFPSGANLNVTNAGIYILTVKNLDNGCESTESFQVVSNQDIPNVVPVLISGILGPINCDNPVLIYEGQLASPNPNVTLTWTNPDGVVIPGNVLVLDEFSTPGTYTLTALDNLNNCFALGTVTPIFDFAVPELELTTGTIFCAPNDQVTLTAADPGDGQTFITWLDPSGTSLTQGLSNPTVSTPGIYTAVATGENGCTSSEQVEVGENIDEPLVSVAPDFELSCRPGEDTYALGGSGEAANGVDPICFSWSLNGLEISTDPNFVVSDAGIYVLTVTNKISNCSSTEIVEVADTRTLPIAVATVQTVLDCNTPQVMLSGDSDDPTVEYIWTSQNGTVIMGQNPLVSESGIWELIVIGSNGCESTAMVEVFEDFSAPQNVNITGDNLLTCQTNNVQLFGSSSSPGILEYAWTLNGDPTLISDMMNPNVGAAGNYTLTVTGENGCTASANFEVLSDEDLPIVMATVSGAINCVNGSVMLFGSSSVINAEYFWTGPPGFAPMTTQNIEVSTPGTYTTTVTDLDNQCEASFSIIVMEDFSVPENVMITGDDQLTCQSNSVQLFGSSSSNGALDYAWTLNGNPSIISNIMNPNFGAPGIYTLTVTGENGCFVSTDFEVTSDENLPVAMASVEGTINCVSESVSIFGTSSATNTAYFWTGPPGFTAMTTQDIEVTIAGDYVLTITDIDNQCEANIMITVLEDREEPVVSIEGNLSVCDGSTGTALSAITDVSNATYFWEGPNGFVSTDADVTIMEAGNYSVVVTNVENGCSTTVSAAVSDSGIFISIESSGVLACSENATIVLDASNSQTTSGNATYTWSSIDGFPIVDADTNLAEVSNPGVYTLTIVDADTGCSETRSVEVLAAEDVDIVPFIEAASCFGDEDGSVEIIVMSGTPPFTISGDLSDLTTNNLAAGTYSVLIVDANECEFSFQVSIPEPEMLILSQNPSPASGGLEVTAEGGTAPYTYFWNDGTTGPVIETPVSGFDYEVIVRDANGCLDTLTTILTNVEEVLIDKNDVNLFPNPNKGAFQFLFESLLDINEIKIYNIHGQVIYHRGSNFSNSTLEFSLENLSQGTYLFEARFDQGVHRQKMIVF